MRMLVHPSSQQRQKSRIIALFVAFGFALVFFRSISYELDAETTGLSPKSRPTSRSAIADPPRLRLDLMAASQVHGWVEKAGPAATVTWHSSANRRRRADWEKFRAKRESGKLRMDAQFLSVPPHGPDPWGCRLYFNHAYKVFFVRTAKTGSTTVIESIFPPCIKGATVPHCFERVADSRMSVAQVEKLWRSYTAFTFTRNVWSRGLSQYQYLVHFLKGNSTEKRGQKCERVRWDDFCADPLALGRVCRENANCCSKLWTHQDWHMRQQTSCFLTDSDPPRWAVDFIGRIEFFDEDMAKLFERLNAQRDKSVPPLKYEPKPPANFNPSACKDGIGGGSAEEEEEESEERRRLTRRRQLLGVFHEIEGNQASDVAYCDKNKFYTEHAACFPALSNFFARDIALLHANLTINPDT